MTGEQVFDEQKYLLVFTNVAFDALAIFLSRESVDP
jgi:hypothetical protein